MSKFIWDADKKKKINTDEIKYFYYGEDRSNYVVYGYTGDLGIVKISYHSSEESAQAFIDELTKDTQQENVKMVMALISSTMKMIYPRQEML